MACELQSGWTTEIQASAAALSPIVAIFGGWIAWQQVRINRNKLKLDRFDKRFAVHEAAVAFAASMAIRSKVDDAQFQDFIKQTRGTRVLINKEMQGYIDLLRTNALKAQVISRALAQAGITDEERAARADELSKLVIWFDTDAAFRAKYIKQHGYEQYKCGNEQPVASLSPSADGDIDKQCREEADLAYQVAQASAKNIPIETTRVTFAKTLTENHVPVDTYNRHMRMINRTYAWQQHGYSLDQILEGNFQACRGTPTLWVP